MNLTQFFEHWSITENPFRGEEARHDAVFTRMVLHDHTAGNAAQANRKADGKAFHSDFEKIMGELPRPATSIVFGEKGSGKTAIRLQLADRVSEHNRAHPDRKVFLIPYDDLNTYLDHYHDISGEDEPLESFKGMRLVDHMDAILSVGVTQLVDHLLGEETTNNRAELGEDAPKRAKRLDRGQKRDLVLLQAVYDTADHAHERTRQLRRLLRVGPSRSRLLWNVLAFGGWILPVLTLVAFFALGDAEGNAAWTAAFIITLGLWGAFLFKRLLWDRFKVTRLGRRLSRQLRMLTRRDDSLSRSLDQLDPLDRTPNSLPLTDSDDHRYSMINRLRRVLRGLGCEGILVVIDRVDEPTLVNGDTDRMRAIVWPMFNNKFLQQEGIGFKMLLPIELRHSLFKESSAFFQEARMDKQNLVERLSWTGPMLYDLCNARLNACRVDGAESISLIDLFAEDVSRQDLVDALDQMHQPRDAFKFLYRCLTEHCSNVTSEQNEWRVPRLVLETVRRHEADRLQQLYRGIRPA